MAENIRKTLLNSFFNSHQIGVKELRDNIETIFPNRELFVKFLKANSSQEQKQLANKIISRLCFSISFPPPSMLIKNLQVYEEEVTHTTLKKDFILQDHFVHLVNLYLLGIYLYVNHKNIKSLINNKINVYKRKLSSKNKSSLNIDPIILFTKMWTHFVVYHDLGYPLEGFKKYNKTTILGNEFTKPYTDIQKYLIKDLTLKTIAKVIAIETIFIENEGCTLQELYFDFFDNISVLKNEHHTESTVIYKLNESKLIVENPKKDIYLEKAQVIFSKGSSFIHIPQLDNSKELLYRVTSLINKNDIIAIIENSETGVPLALISGQKDSPIIFLQSKASISKSLLSKNLYDCTFYEGNLTSNRFTIRYFINKPDQQYQSLLNEMFIDESVRNSFIEVKNDVKKNKTYYEYQLKKSSTIEDIEFFTYYYLQDILGYTITDDINYLPIAQITNSYANANQNVAKKIPIIISDLIRENYKNYIEENKDFKPNIILKEEFPIDAANQFFDKVIELKSKVCLQLSKELLSNLKTCSDKEVNLKIVMKCIQNLFDSNTKIDCDEKLDSYFNSTFLANSDGLSEISKIEESIFKIWENSLSKMGLLSLNKIIKEYKPDFTSVDHGIYSSLVFLKSLNIYKNAFNKEKKDVFYKLISLFHEGNSYTGSVYLQFENDFFAENVGVSILLHNLYPSKFKDSTLQLYRNKISVNPFNFLAIFADTFQKWDRDKLINPSKKNDIEAISGSNYNLEVKDDIVFVSITTSQSTLKDIEIDLMKILGDFLFNGDKMIKFIVRQE